MSFSRPHLSQASIITILNQQKMGVLSTSNSANLPYGVPLNYFYDEEENAIFIHCAKHGQKVTNITENSNVSFCVVGKDQIIEESFTTHYSSAIIMGLASIIKEDEVYKKELLLKLCAHLTPTSTQRRDEVIQKYLSNVAFIKIQITSMSGKENHDS